MTELELLGLLGGFGSGGKATGHDAIDSLIAGEALGKGVGGAAQVASGPEVAAPAFGANSSIIEAILREREMEEGLKRQTKNPFDTLGEYLASMLSERMNPQDAALDEWARTYRSDPIDNPDWRGHPEFERNLRTLERPPRP